MKNYRKKPVVIQAIQWDGTEQQALEIASIENFEGKLDYKKKYEYVEGILDKSTDIFEGFYIDTLEGLMQVSPNDYVIKGLKGEFYPCKPEIFKLSYDSLDATESFLDRVIKEKADLAEKTSKLKDFIENNPKFDELTNINRILLINQFNAMELYLYALDSRIEFIND
jgi:hypothetical protein